MPVVRAAARVGERVKLGSSLTIPPVSVSQTSPGTVRSIVLVKFVRRRLTSP